MSREWASASEALGKARRELGPIWFERASIVFRSLMVEGSSPKGKASTARRRARQAIMEIQERALRSRLLLALNEFESQPPGVAGLVGELNPWMVNRSEFVRVLVGSRRDEDPDFPGATAWALFDVAKGLTAPPRDLPAWRSLVSSWQSDLRRAGVGSATARKRHTPGSER